MRRSILPRTEPIDPHEAPTPKAGSFEKWNIFAEDCRLVAVRIESMAAEKVVANDTAGAARAKELVAVAFKLAAEFDDWKRQDPGQDVRHDQIRRLFVLREAAEALTR